MITLAIECSSDVASVAVWVGDREPAVHAWRQERRGTGSLFDHLATVLAESGVALSGVERFVVGRGPGRFSAMRMAMACAQAAALPGARPVWAVNSAEALARGVADAHAVGRVCVVGDARRDCMWVGRVECRDGITIMEEPWRALPPAEVAGKLAGAELAVSPHWSRMGARLPDAARTACPWIEDDLHPSAVDIGGLAMARDRQGVPGEPLVPLYLHPPVRAE